MPEGREKIKITRQNSICKMHKQHKSRVMTRRVALANKYVMGSQFHLGFQVCTHNTLSKEDNPGRMSKVSALALRGIYMGPYQCFFFNQFYVVSKGVIMIHRRI